MIKASKKRRSKYISISFRSKR